MFEVSKYGKLDTLIKFNFTFLPQDINIRDKNNNTPLYYAVNNPD